MTRLFTIWTVHWLIFCVGGVGFAQAPRQPTAAADATSAQQLRLATFVADITPPVGDGLGIGFMPRFERIEHPLLAKGFVVENAGETYVVCAVDLCGLCNASYDLFRNKLAQAAGTVPGRVAVQSLHQHTAPVFDADARRILFQDDTDRLNSGLQLVEQIAEKTAAAVRESLKHKTAVTHVGTSQATVERVASSRRLLQPDGSILTRLSSTKDAALRQAPEGLIDSQLRTVTFFNGNQRVVQAHYYATHPQSYYGDGRITYDVPGIARERLEKETDVFQVYFTGCGGNVAMGKYNNGTLAAREELTQRLYAAMRQSAGGRIDKHAVGRVSWKSATLELPLRTETEFSVDANRQLLDNARARFGDRLKAAMNLAWIDRVQAKRGVELSCLSLGEVHLLHLPGEPFVELQLAAQQMVGDGFVAVAGYSECAMWYMGPDKMYTDRGGYEQTWAFAGPCEKLLLRSIRNLLTGTEAGTGSPSR